MCISNKVLAALVLAMLGGFAACGGSSDETENDEAESGTWRDALRFYEKARQTGEEAPGDAYEWMRQDLERVGDWQYRVLVLDGAGEAEIEEKLNEMGRDRWDCFAALAEGSSLRLLFKRPVESYVGAIPHNELLKLLRDRDEGEETPAN